MVGQTTVGSRKTLHYDDVLRQRQIAPICTAWGMHAKADSADDASEMSQCVKCKPALVKQQHNSSDEVCRAAAMTDGGCGSKVLKR